MKCATCGEEHEILDPTFRRPDAVVRLPSAERTKRVKESDDLCTIWASSDAERHRYFVRCVLKVALLDAEGKAAWGLWAEVAEADFRSIVEKWSDPQQASLPAIEALLANRIPDYPDTVGLPATLRMTGPTTRPELVFDRLPTHPFAVECTEGVSTHRLMEWLDYIG
jgi:hypothetical protein